MYILLVLSHLWSVRITRVWSVLLFGCRIVYFIDATLRFQEFDGDAYNTQTVDEEEDTLSDFDKKIMRRIDGVLDKYNERKNNDLKSILKGISDKERRRRESVKSSEAKRAKKEAAYQKEVKEEKARYEALEKLDKASY